MFEQRDEDGTFLPGARAAAPPSMAQGRATEESKQKKGSITEEDVCTLLQRYSAATILALLKEVHQVVDVKLDWQELVKKTDTGIKSAREYQMLWRHLAYRQHLIEKIDPLDQPLDDDSDLEYELEACPPASTGDALEASNCVKTLICRSTNKSRLPNSASVEVQRASSAVPFVHKPSQLSQAAGTSGEGLNANGPTSNNQRKRKLSSEEDRELIAPVAARKVELKGERNSTQRTQRAPAKKKQAVGGANTAGTLLSAKQEATRHAIKMALKDGPTTVGNGHAGSTNAAKITSPKGNFPITKVAAPSSQPNSSLITTAPSSGKPAPIASSSKLCPQKKAPPAPPPPPLPPSSVSANSIQAAAVAAGARIISSSDAASLLKVTQSKNAMHIKGGPPVKTSAAAISSSLPPNVHLMTGSSTPTTVAAGTSSSVLSAQQSKGNVVGSTAPPVSQLPKMRAASTVAMERSSSNATTTARIHEDVASVSQCLPKASPSTGDGPAKQTAAADESQCTMNRDVDGMEGKDVTCKPVVEEGPHLKKKDSEKPCAVQRFCIPSVNGTHGISPTAVSDGGAEKMEVSSERLHGDPVI